MRQLILGGARSGKSRLAEKLASDSGLPVLYIATSQPLDGEMNDRVQRLEEKVSYLERHVTEQDKAMLELVEALARLRQELRTLRERPTGAAAGEGEADPADGRPPHY